MLVNDVGRMILIRAVFWKELCPMLCTEVAIETVERAVQPGIRGRGRVPTVSDSKKYYLTAGLLDK